MAPPFIDCMGKIARIPPVLLTRQQKQEPAKWSWRACNAAILHGHAGNVPDKIVFGCQGAMRAINLSLYYPLHFRGKIGLWLLIFD
jgi:hypothetical protein